MYWEKKDSSERKFSSLGVTTWLPEAEKPVENNMKGTVIEMTKLRSQTTPIYVKAVLKENEVTANCDVRSGLFLFRQRIYF